MIRRGKPNVAGDGLAVGSVTVVFVKDRRNTRHSHPPIHIHPLVPMP